jgi:hypothetical protein
MELFLNAFWLLLALLSVGLWWTQWSPTGSGRAARQASLRGGIALCCVLVLLFFAISLTDDLHEIPAVAEDTGSSQRPLQIWKASPPSPESGKHAAPSGDAVVSRLYYHGGVVVGRVVPADAASPQTVSSQPFQGRAPPSPRALTL